MKSDTEILQAMQTDTVEIAKLLGLDKDSKEELAEVEDILKSLVVRFEVLIMRTERMKAMGAMDIIIMN